MKECPSNYYSKQENKLCKKCAPECDGCRGPLNTIGEDGCIDCRITLVDNDFNNTIISCIYSSNFTCSHGFAKYEIENKRNKFICRKCHEECDGCNEIKHLSEQNCIKCKNLYRHKTKECTKKCSFDEYLEIESNVRISFFNSQN